MQLRPFPFVCNVGLEVLFFLLFMFREESGIENIVLLETLNVISFRIFSLNQWMKPLVLPKSFKTLLFDAIIFSCGECCHGEIGLWDECALWVEEMVVGFWILFCAFASWSYVGGRKLFLSQAIPVPTCLIQYSFNLFQKVLWVFQDIFGHGPLQTVACIFWAFCQWRKPEGNSSLWSWERCWTWVYIESGFSHCCKILNCVVWTLEPKYRNLNMHACLKIKLPTIQTSKRDVRHGLHMGSRRIIIIKTRTKLI